MQKCRTLLERAVNSASDDPELACDALLELEREQGHFVAVSRVRVSTDVHYRYSEDI